MKIDSVVFYKMQGSGNDFILIENKELGLPENLMSAWAAKLCPRAFAVGADGLIFLGESAKPGVDYKWDFFNSDGSRAEMCGNGSRCAARLAYQLGIAGQDHVFDTDAGSIEARIIDDNSVRVQLPPVKETKLNLSISFRTEENFVLHFANTGVPHCVVICEDVNSVDVLSLGRAIRNHDQFAPQGANVNFIQVIGNDQMLLRTYERGVENETYACGTGAAAAAVVAFKLGLCSSDVRLTTSGGEVLGILIENDKIFLSGKTTFVYKGELNPSELEL
ncbi:MAG: diaminopimelate epimerase [Thermodesulfobacteriota bacterium]